LFVVTGRRAPIATKTSAIGRSARFTQNAANGNEETITIRPDGSAEVRTRGEAPRYGTFAGETLTIESRISRVEPARGGVVIDGAYYRR
jgi:hypothetical protein